VKSRLPISLSFLCENRPWGCVFVPIFIAGYDWNVKNGPAMPVYE
jgi:hypothetical protein